MLQPWNGEMAAREEKGIREPGNSGPADPPLRSGLSLRFETLLVGIADRFHRSLRSPVRQSLRSLRLCPALRLREGRPPPAPPHLSTGGRRGKGCSQAVDHLALRTRFVRGGRPVGRPAARPSRSSSRHGSPVGRQASGAGTGAGPYIESPRTPGGTCTRCPTAASRETEEASS